MANRVAMELDSRRGRGGRRPSYRLPDVAARLLRGVVRQHATGAESAAQLRGWNDYELAVASRVSVRQTAELYEEIGLGLLVREALDRLEEKGMLQIERKSASGPYRGFAPTADGVAAVDLRPWYRRLLAFFDPPESHSSRPV